MFTRFSKYFIVGLIVVTAGSVALAPNLKTGPLTTGPLPDVNEASDHRPAIPLVPVASVQRPRTGEPWPGYWIAYEPDEILPNGLQIEVANGVVTGIARQAGDTSEYHIVGTRYCPGDIDATDVTRQLWRRVKMTLRKPDGSYAKLDVLRPLWWFTATGAKAKAEVDLSMHEVGIEGIALVNFIGSCDADFREEDVNANFVIGTIEHSNAIVWNLVFNGDNATPLGVTANHPIFSAERDDWVPAGELRIGERVRTFDGTATLTFKSRRPTRQTVYNLEVHREHAYHVSQFGILAHNTGIGCGIPWSSRQVGLAASALKAGATEVRVASRSLAEELFLRLYQGHGYKNVTGWARDEVKRFGKVGTYHWDEAFEGASKSFPGRQILKGHYDDGKLHSYVPHLQIHTLEGPIVRILFD